MSTAKSTSAQLKQPLFFPDLGTRQVVADFSGGTLSIDAGALLLRQVDAGLGLIPSLAQCFNDARNPIFVDHSGGSAAGPTYLGARTGLRRSQRSPAAATGSFAGDGLQQNRSAGPGPF